MAAVSISNCSENKLLAGQRPVIQSPGSFERKGRMELEREGKREGTREMERVCFSPVFH